MNNKFNSKQEIDHALNLFKNGNYLKNGVHDYNLIRSSFFELFKTFPIPCLHLKKEFLESINLYRTRIVSEVNNESLISEFSYPPRDCKVKTQRANWTGRNVFYASDTPYTSLSELKESELENEYYISQWKFNLKEINRSTILVSTLAIDNISKKNPWEHLLKSSTDWEIKFRKTEKNKDAELSAYLLKKISKLFTDLNSTRYHLSAFIADNSIYHLRKDNNRPMFPILLFPSVENSLSSCNFAIHPDFVDKHLKLDKVVKVKIKRNKSNSFRYTYSDIALVKSKDTLSWYSTEIDKKLSMYQIQVIKSSCGKIINFPDLENTIFYKQGVKIIHQTLIYEAIQRNNINDLYKLEDILQNEDLIIAKEIKIEDKPLTTTFELDHVKRQIHSFIFVIRQPFLKERKINENIYTDNQNQTIQ